MEDLETLHCCKSVANVTVTLNSELTWVQSPREMQECQLKGTVHPNIKILSSFTNPYIIQTLYDYLCSVRHTHKNIFWKMSQCFFNHTMKVNGVQHFDLTSYGQKLLKHSSKYLICAEVKQVSNNPRVSKKVKHLHFLVNYFYLILR